MTDDQWRRRHVLRTTAALAGTGLIAGCTSDDGEDEETETGGGSGGGNNAGDESGDEDGDSYSVTMEPVGTVEFDSVPETWAANNGSWADMGIALGQQPPEAVYLTSRYHTQLYDEIPGLDVDKSDMTSLWGGELDPEQFLELSGEVDVFVIDPNFPIGRTDHWDEDDITQIEATGTPFFGNSIFSRGYEWHDYEYLSLYEAFEKLAEVFQERERYEAFESLHEEFQATLEDVVPSEDDRPSVAIMWASGDEPDSFSPYIIDGGTSFKQWRDLDVTDALAETDVEDFHAGRSEVDYETLLEVDPDVILLRGHEGKTADEFADTVRAYMEDHNVASDLEAVQNGDVYRGGPLYQGPITNLVLTERAAKQVYDVDEELFDRDRVVEIVEGDL
ncbi:Fe3+-hydroxamate ABC transporter substrate-binding protein [Halobiforma lacisalsi AJ5]|uniref:Fe3+-hydroxamate ABC transporter periplasmic component-like protein n=1 Tax=Natronobacterium lacisalsi AJ5 TaxID=358396 RepID=M0LMV9_NATLA|nr:ABC transporter substrate-binding protein [Halobiforma lacisalsi]APW96858.1 Fe3+-hydroxamate ABC transporter substrate-binding protein [Halobiforma lacisalsi AJ5]EMA34887.1 Fe3+-hydroxamate ABC transporter periplasmic component-like protein [Halobiforma lacisalsi AJ5]